MQQDDHFTTQPQEILTIPEAAMYLRVSVETIRRYCRAGKLSFIKIGKEYRIRKSDIDKLFNK